MQTPIFASNHYIPLNPFSQPRNIKNKCLTETIQNKIQSYAVKSKGGYTFSKNSLKENEDSYFTIANFCGNQSLYFFGVMDGHGLNGKESSRYVMRKLPGIYL